MPRLRGIALVLIVPHLLAGCGSTDPEMVAGDGGLTISIPSAVLSASVVAGVATASCQVQLEALREPDRSIGWRDLQLISYRDAALTQPFDTVTMSGNAVGAIWDGPFGPDDRSLAHLSFTAATPFYLAARFRYFSSGTRFEHPPVVAACVPNGAAGTAPPSLHGLSIDDPDGLIQPPEPVAVNLALLAPAGGWQGTLRISGPPAQCSASMPFSGPLQTSLELQLVLTVPAACAGLDSLNLSVSYTDALNRELAATRRIPMTIPDTTPPVITVLSPFEAFYGFEGNPLFLDYNGRDNRDLAWLVWESSLGERDSSRVSGLTVSLHSQTVLARGSWVNQTVTLRYWLKDAVGLTSNVLKTDPIRIYPTVSAPIVTRQVAGGMIQALFDPKRDRVYVLHLGQDRMSILSAETLETIAELPRAGLSAMDFSPSGDSLVLAGDHHRMGMLSLAAPTAIDTFSYTDDGALGDVVTSVFMLANGKAYLSTGDGGPGGEVDLTTRRARIIANPLTFLTRSGDFTRAIVTSGQNVQVFRSETGALHQSRATPWSPWTRTNQDASLIAVGPELFNGNLNPLGPLLGEFRLWGPGNSPLAISADGSTIVYSDHSSGLVRADPVTRRPVVRVPLPFGWPQEPYIALSPDGKRAMIAEAPAAGNVRLAMVSVP